MVQCPVCNTEFDIDTRGGVCPNGHPYPDEQSSQADSEPITAEGTCPQCGAEVEPGDKFCISCGQRLGEADTVKAPPVPDQLRLETDGGDIEVADEDIVGREVRTAALKAGKDKSEVRRIHREQVQFYIDDDGVTMEVLGVNVTRHNGDALEDGDIVSIEEGDTITFSEVIEATVRFD